MLIVNPGATLPPAEQAHGWTNTYEAAKAEAHRWLDRMREDGLTDIEILPDDGIEREGRWTFTFRHTVTGVTVELETHGIDNESAYRKQWIFPPRVYWNGSSSSNPDLSQFAAPGYAQTFRRVD